jgi:hypothetical protein
MDAARAALPAETFNALMTTAARLQAAEVAGGAR